MVTAALMLQADLRPAAKSKGRKDASGNGQNCQWWNSSHGEASLAAAGSQAVAGTAKTTEEAAS